VSDVADRADRRRGELVRLSARRARDLLDVVGSKVADARAHAEASLTGTLVDTPDGRPTLARVRRSRSLLAAGARLDELLARLAGPSSRSLDGLVRDAWEAAYRDCLAWWLGELPESVRIGRPEPTAAGLRGARSAVIEGRDARDWLAGPVEAARRGLKARVAAAASPAVGEAERRRMLAAWASGTARTLAQSVTQLVAAGVFRADDLASRAAVRPELRHDDAT
jgi:hypothetical protein